MTGGDMKPIVFVATTVLFTFSIVSTLMAQSAANQMSTLPMTAIGTTALDTVSSSGALLDDFSRSSKPDFDLVIARRSSIRGAAPLVSLTSPNPKGGKVVGQGEGVMGFAGLSHRDQRLADRGNQFSHEPPDQALAVGNDFLLEAVNTALAVYDPQGRLLAGPVSLNRFFNLASEFNRTTNKYGPFLSDPKAYFDRQTRRWFVTVVEIDQDPVTGAFGRHSSVLVAVSHTDDPRRAYSLFSIDTTNDGTNGTPRHLGCPCFGDQPLIGADTNGFFVTTNEFSISNFSIFNGAQIYAISKKLLAAAVAPPPVTLFSNLPLAEGLAYSVQPATSARLQEDHDDRASKGGVEYFVSALDFQSTLDNRIAVWAMTNTASLSAPRPNVKLTKVVITSEVYGQPPNADQRPGPTPLRDFLASLGDTNEPLEQLATNDDRMNQVVFADGKLWSGVNTIIRQGAKFRAGIAFFSVKPELDDDRLKAEVEQQGYVSVPGNDVMFPSISVDNGGNATMVFTLAGPQFFPSAAFSQVNDQEGNDDGEQSVHIIAAGAAPEDGFTGYFFFGGNGVARWGDYSAATTDENGNVWIATEFIPAGTRTLVANWGTFIARRRSNGN
jgi:hypothetical protein